MVRMFDVKKNVQTQEDLGSKVPFQLINVNLERN